MDSLLKYLWISRSNYQRLVRDAVLLPGSSEWGIISLAHFEQKTGNLICTMSLVRKCTYGGSVCQRGTVNLLVLGHGHTFCNYGKKTQRCIQENTSGMTLTFRCTVLREAVLRAVVTSRCLCLEQAVLLSNYGNIRNTFPGGDQHSASMHDLLPTDRHKTFKTWTKQRVKQLFVNSIHNTHLSACLFGFGNTGTCPYPWDNTAIGHRWQSFIISMCWSCVFSQC